MANLTPVESWDDVPQIETDTPLLGGPGGPLNQQAQALLNRTESIVADLAGLADAVIAPQGTSMLGLTENATHTISSADFTGTVTNITVADVGATLTFAKAGAAATAQAPGIDISGADWLLYLKVKLSSGAAGEAVNIILGPAGSASLSLSLGYDWVAGAAAAGCVSVQWAGTNKILLTGQDYTSDYLYVCLHYDSNFGGLMAYTKSGGTYTLVGSVDGDFVYTQELRVTFAGSASVGTIATLDTRFFAKPNIIAIGDSICKGATLFDPNPATASKNYASCWQSYVDLSPVGVENTLIINKGIGGQDSSQIGGRIVSDVIANAPRVCVLHLSTNDYGSGFTTAERTQYTQNSLDLLAAAGVSTYLLSAVYPNSNASNYPLNTQYYQGYMDAAGGFADLVGYAAFIDFMTDQIGDANNELQAALGQADGVHPTPSGYAIIGGLIEGTLLASGAVPNGYRRVGHSLEIDGDLVVHGVIRGASSADQGAEKPFGYLVFIYNDGTGAWTLSSRSTNPENTAYVSCSIGASADRLRVELNRAGIAPAAIANYGTFGPFFGIGRVISVLNTGAGSNKQIEYAIRKIDGTTPTGAELNGMRFLVSY